MGTFSTCEALNEAIVEAVRARVVEDAERVRADGPPDSIEHATNVAVPQTTPTASPIPPRLVDGFLWTHVPVPGVDEADVVATDGANLHLLSETALLTLRSQPPAETALRTRVFIDGYPEGLLLDGDRALIVSGGRRLNLYAPPPCRMRAPSSNDPRCFLGVTKLTLLDLGTTPPQVIREVYVEGDPVSAHRHGDVARVVVERAPALPLGGLDARGILGRLPSHHSPMSQAHLDELVDEWLAAAMTTIDETVLEDWLPVTYDSRRGTLEPLEPDCTRVHVPPGALAGGGSTSILTLDLHDDESPIDETTLVDDARWSFVGRDAILLTRPDRNWLSSGQLNGRTALHAFDLSTDPPATTYRTSGFVEGSAFPEDLAVDERNDVIHVASRLAYASERSATTRLASYRVDGTALTEVGTTADLAEPVSAVRYQRARAYLALGPRSFADRTGRLLVVDLRRPAAPAILGEVETPERVRSLHPLGEHHLLTIGEAGTGTQRRPVLRIFDVSSPRRPQLTHTHTFPGHGRSLAVADHRPLLFDADAGLLALPYHRGDGDHRSSLVLLDVDPRSGFAIRGEVDHTPLGSPCPFRQRTCGRSAFALRGLLIEDWLYSIGTHGVLVSHVADLAPVAQVPLR